MNKLVIFMILIIFSVGFLFQLFTDETDGAVISDIHGYSFSDTIINVYSQKYKGTIIVVTSLKSRDSVLWIDGKNGNKKILFSSYSDMGIEAWQGANTSLLLKKQNSDSFYLHRQNQIIGFRLNKSMRK